MSFSELCLAKKTKPYQYFTEKELVNYIGNLIPHATVKLILCQQDGKFLPSNTDSNV